MAATCTGSVVQPALRPLLVPCTMCSELQWPALQGPEDWLLQQPREKWAERFSRDGYLVVHNLIGMEEVEVYRDVYRRMVQGEIDTSLHRHDLGNQGELLDLVSFVQDMLCS
ncbi:hypothetical protein Bbelb_230890 [Branchiostoma belcheri]|nr:hypothetical protein Bbelb_230890 [Branchiostoma belcheri]